MSAAPEAGETFDCFGSSCTVLVIGEGGAGSAREAVALAKRRLLTWHEQFSRFLPDSELSRLNADPRSEVPATPLMVRLAQAVRDAGALSRGLVDATLIDEIESAGYDSDLGLPVPLAAALALAPERAPAAPAARAGWRELDLDSAGGTIIRPPGVKLDSGGLAKGMFADVLAEMLADHEGFAINCAGDLRIGGTAGLTRAVNVESPFDGRVLHTFQLQSSGVATSGIGRRSWRDAQGRPAHHLLDPATGRPAFTGIVLATALAPSALMAETYAKAAILSGPQGAARWLRDGGVIVLDDGSHRVIEPPRVVTLRQLSGHAQS